MRILVGCERSGKVRAALRARGHDAWSCDLEPADDGSPHHIQGDVRGATGEEWDMAIFFPPCTHLASSGARWFAEKRRDGRQQAALLFVLHLWNHTRAPKIALENPVGVLSTQFRKPDQIIQPWQFGHPETKTTCLWLRGLPPLAPTNIVEPDYMRRPDGSYYTDAKGKRYSRVHWLSGRNPDRARLRSETYQGIADAMAEQWGALA